MDRFGIDDIAKAPVWITGTTFYYYDVDVRDHYVRVPGHVVVTIDDAARNHATRERIVKVLNTMVEEHGAANVLAALQSADGVKI
jgi:hypothetical protein